MNNDNIPWTEKYRPINFSNIKSHDLVKNILINMINDKNIYNLILYGPPGVGKTTLINACLNKIYGDNYKLFILELNGSDDRGINVVREEIKNYANTTNLYNNKIKLIVLDETDSMTHDAQYALKEIIELYDYNTKFCLICNFINKIIYPLQSSCIIFRLPSIPKKYIENFLLNVIDIEKLNYTKGGINSIIKLSYGDLRKSCNNLQSVFLSYGEINKNNVYDCLGIPKIKEINNIFLYIKKKNLEFNIKYVNNLRINYGYSLNILIQFIIEKILEFDIENINLIDIIIYLANVEYNISNLGTEKIQTFSLISILYKFKHLF